MTPEERRLMLSVSERGDHAGADRVIAAAALAPYVGNSGNREPTHRRWVAMTVAIATIAAVGALVLLVLGRSGSSLPSVARASCTVVLPPDFSEQKVLLVEDQIRSAVGDEIAVRRLSATQATSRLDAVHLDPEILNSLGSASMPILLEFTPTIATNDPRLGNISRIESVLGVKCE